MSNDRISMLWISDLITPTGFSRVSHGILSNIPREKYNIVGLGVNYRGDPHGMSFPIYPAMLGGDVYGVARLKDILSTYKIDLIFILNDIWIINEYLRELKKIYTDPVKLPKIVVYFPVDGTGHSPNWYKNLDIVQRANVYTKFGKNVAESIYPYKEFNIIPHGIDKTTFHKLYEKRIQAKEILYGKAANKELFGEESFIFLNANRNQPRKRLELTMEGFKLFSEGKSSAVSLYMHCGNIDARHIDVRELSTRFGIGQRLIVSGNVTGIQTAPDNKLNLIYNASDVGVNTGLGEGWGLPNMEHAITGAPQIVPDHSACSEIYKDCGILIPTHSDLMLDGGAMIIGRLVSVEAVAEAMEKIYTDKKLYEELSTKSIAKFSAEEYSWEVIGATWNKIFESVM